MFDHVRSTEHVTQEDGIVYLSNDAVQLCNSRWVAVSRSNFVVRPLHRWPFFMSPLPRICPSSLNLSLHKALNSQSKGSKGPEHGLRTVRCNMLLSIGYSTSKFTSYLPIHAIF